MTALKVLTNWINQKKLHRQVKNCFFVAKKRHSYRCRPFASFKHIVPKSTPHLASTQAWTSSSEAAFQNDACVSSNSSKMPSGR